MTEKKNIMNRHSFPLGMVGVGCLLFLFTACASQLPLDDAYYWPDKRAAVVQTQPAATENAAVQAGSATPAEPSMEIISAQDTTITVKIKR